ncbi:MAG: hypothetical protein JWL71_4997 [Acidobacteria bacterium]|nr:hypothetical protein [Acidobacteriota bacterium]
MPSNERPGGAGSGGGGQGLMHSIQQQANSALSSQKDRAADSIKAVIDAVRQTGESLREKNGTIAGYADSAASQLERFSSQLRDRDISELMDDVGAFARRRPALFVGGGIALGLAAARFLKSSGTDNMSGRASGYMSTNTRDYTSSTSGQSTQQFATAGAYGASGTAGSSGSSGSSGSMDSGEAMGMTSESSAAGIAADRPSGRAARGSRPRARTTDER